MTFSPQLRGHEFLRTCVLGTRTQLGLPASTSGSLPGKLGLTENSISIINFDCLRELVTRSGSCRFQSKPLPCEVLGSFVAVLPQPQPFYRLGGFLLTTIQDCVVNPFKSLGGITVVVYFLIRRIRRTVSSE